MKIELREMKSVVTLADHLHFGRAAAALHLSQPALTKQIHKVEDLLGGPLFVRRPRQLALTRAGGVFVGRIRPLLNDADLSEDLFRRAMLGEAGVVRVGFGPAPLAHGLADVIRHYRSRFPGVQVAMREMSTITQLEALDNGVLDVGFVRVPVSSPLLSAWPLFRDRLVIAVGSEIHSQRQKGLKAFARSPFVAIPRSTSPGLYDHVLRTCRAAGFSPHIVQEVSELYTALNLVRAGVGVAIVPESTRAFRVPRVRYVETGIPAVAFDIGLAVRKNPAPDPVIGHFLTVVRQSYSRDPDTVDS